MGVVCGLLSWWPVVAASLLVGSVVGWFSFARGFRVGVSPAAGGYARILTTETVDDPRVVQHAASGLSLCRRDDHAAEKRAGDGRRDRVCDLGSDGLAANDPSDLWRLLIFHVTGIV